MKYLPVFSVLLVLVACIDACSEPLGYESWDVKRVMASIDLLLNVKFLSNNTYSSVSNNGKVYNIKLNAEVLCVVHNKNNVQVPKNINITERRRGSLDNWENPCIDFWHTIKFNEPVFIMVVPRDDEFGFVIKNLQGPYFYPSEFDQDKLLKGCDNLKPKAPSGGDDKTCPLKAKATSGNCIDLKVASSASSLVPLKAAALAGLIVIFRILL